MGPYPYGDVNQDCTFSGKDALLCAQFTLVSDDVDATAAFLLANPGVSIFKMDADFNERVETRDTFVLFYILFGGLRFVTTPQLTLDQQPPSGSLCGMTISMNVEQSSSDGTFDKDPSRAAKTKLIVLFTGYVLFVFCFLCCKCTVLLAMYA